MSSLSWYYHRLRTMSLPEIGFRAQQYWQKKKERKVTGHVPFVTLNSLPTPILPIGNTFIDTEDTIIDIFGLPFNYSLPIDWHLDISSQQWFPQTFAKDINIRTEKYGSAKHVWEVNRLQFLPLIALRYRQTQDERYLQQFQHITQSWIDENPYLLGVSWYSNIEVNIRLIVWFFCWEILDVNALMRTHSRFKLFVETDWLPSIYLHCQYSHRNPSKFSSANNHLVSEYAGLFIAASFWPFEESEQWKKIGKAGLEREIQLQHSAQGINKEEAAEYIQFITDFFLIAYVVGNNTGNAFSTTYGKRLHNIIDYIFQLTDMRGNISFYGDEDDGKVVILDTGHPDNFKSLLVSGSILFGNSLWKIPSTHFDNKNAVLFGEQGQATWEAMNAQSHSVDSKFYEEEGHFLLKKREDEQEIYVHFDAAPLGFLSIAAHGHADALSFVLHVDGHPVIVDVGTYTYHTEAEWRRYFIGTLAHNTVRIDETDQATSTGPTMWVQHYHPVIVHHESGEHKDMVVAEHDGYQKRGVMHRRSIALLKQQNRLRIVDSITLTPLPKTQTGDATSFASLGSCQSHRRASVFVANSRSPRRNSTPRLPATHRRGKRTDRPYPGMVFFLFSKETTHFRPLQPLPCPRVCPTHYGNIDWVAFIKQFSLICIDIQQWLV